MATQADSDKANADFAAEFNEDKAPKPPVSDDEAFGLAGDDEGGEAGAAGGADAGAPGQDGAAAGGGEADASAAAAVAPADAAAANEQALKDRADALDAREKELDARAASIQTSNTNEVQTSSAADDTGGKGDEGSSAESPKDPRAALAEDFGPEFVQLLEAFIKDVVSGSVSEQVGPVQSLVQSVIDDLKNERNVAHFKTIAAAHEDFQDIVESPDFKSWLAGLPEAEKADMDKIVESGSAHEIIHMLTKFKESKNTDGTGANEDALDNAEGVRSGGLRLPTEPRASEDYAAAWNEA